MATVKEKKAIKKTASKTPAGLNLQQEKFCRLYVSGDREIFGNGTMCYLEVYGAEYLVTHKKNMTYQVAMSNASRLLRNDKIIRRVNELLEIGGFTDEHVDKQHLFLINQFADLKTKLGAVKEYNSLKKRVAAPNGNTFNTVVFQGEQAERIARRILTRGASSAERPDRLPDSDESEV